MSLAGIDKNWKTDTLWGILFGIGFLVLMSITAFGTIGIPSIPTSIAGDMGRWLIIVVCASIFESFLFFEFLLDFLDEKLVDLPFGVASLITSLTFAGFHFTAYGSSLTAMGGSFISATIVGFLWCYLKKYTKSILPVIICHAIINAWLLTKLAVVF